MTLSQVHLAEQRRYLEGRRLRAEVLDAQTDAAVGDDTPEQHRRKRGRKQRAAAHFAEQRGLT